MDANAQAEPIRRVPGDTGHSFCAVRSGGSAVVPAAFINAAAMASVHFTLIEMLSLGVHLNSMMTIARMSIHTTWGASPERVAFFIIAKMGRDIGSGGVRLPVPDNAQRQVRYL